MVVPCKSALEVFGKGCACGFGSAHEASWLARYFVQDFLKRVPPLPGTCTPPTLTLPRIPGLPGVCTSPDNPSAYQSPSPPPSTPRSPSATLWHPPASPLPPLAISSTRTPALPDDTPLRPCPSQSNAMLGPIPCSDACHARHWLRLACHAKSPDLPCRGRHGSLLGAMACAVHRTQRPTALDKG